MTGIDAEPLRELTVRQLPLLAFLTEHLEDPHAEWMPECLQLLRLVED